MTKIKLTREEMIERLGDYWTNEFEDMSANDLRQFAHDLMMQSLQRRNTRDLVKEIDEIMEQATDEDEDDDR